MILLRIIDKQTNLFIRDDFDYDEETEIALDVEPSQGLYLPKWNGTEWVEGLTEEEIQAIKDSTLPTEPSLEERLQALEIMELERILGGM